MPLPPQYEHVSLPTLEDIGLRKGQQIFDTCNSNYGILICVTQVILGTMLEQTIDGRFIESRAPARYRVAYYSDRPDIPHPYQPGHPIGRHVHTARLEDIRPTD